jgi:transposase
MASKKLEEKKQALELIKLGKSQKEIAKTVKVTEKTVGLWTLEWRTINNNKLESIRNLNARLKELTANKEASIDEIKDLIATVTELEKGVFLK